MSKYINVKRVEFVITNNCTGKCKHCSRGGADGGEAIDAGAAAALIEELADEYSIDSVMTFGGEPLLYADTVCAIHKTARDKNIEKRDIISNGFFSEDKDKITGTAGKIIASGVRKILLSVDAFHEESIPLEPVLYFARTLIDMGFKELKLQPAWLVDKDHDNSYNKKTKELLDIFERYGIEESRGNVIFPEGNAVKYLREYFRKPDTDSLFAPCGTTPYSEKIDDVSSISVEPNGDIKVCYFTIGNIYKNSVLKIIENYNPHDNLYTRLLAEGGIRGLYGYLKENGTEINVDDCYSPCMICKKIMEMARNGNIVPKEM